MKLTDEYIVSILWPNKLCLLNRCKDRLTKDIEEYLKNRFKLAESLYEALYCIKFNIDRDNIKCPICGSNNIKFRGNGLSKRGPFLNGCSKKCQYIYRDLHSQKTCLNKYGAKSPRENKEINSQINEKRKQTCFKKYGVEHGSQSELIKEKHKQTCLKKYGVEYSFQASEVKEKIHNTCLKKYGVDWAFQSELAKMHQKETLIKKYGVTNSFLIPDVVESFKQRKDEIQKKRDNTKRKNKTFGASIPENKSYNLLLKLFDEEDILRQYKSDKYPFNCDFYIISKDLYIECNYFWTHHGHFFNKESDEDQKILKEMYEKSKTHPFYLGAINTWIEGDIKKLNIAKENKLNYLVFWTILELENWIDTYGKN